MKQLVVENKDRQLRRLEIKIIKQLTNKYFDHYENEYAFIIKHRYI